MRFADSVRDRGRVCDLGCGPGHVARYLRARGVEVFGLDISPRMVEVAARLNRDISFVRGDMLALDVPDEALSGVVALYSLIHVSRESAVLALQESHRPIGEEPSRSVHSEPGPALPGRPSRKAVTPASARARAAADGRAYVSSADGNRWRRTSTAYRSTAARASSAR